MVKSYERSWLADRSQRQALGLAGRLRSWHLRLLPGNSVLHWLCGGKHGIEEGPVNAEVLQVAELRKADGHILVAGVRLSLAALTSRRDC